MALHHLPPAQILNSKSDREFGKEIVWIIVIFITPVLGLIIYPLIYPLFAFGLFVLQYPLNFLRDGYG